MSNLDLDKLMLLHAGATPGPWKVTDKCAHLYITDSNPNREIAKIGRKPKAYAENASYIVEACNAIPELLRMIKELQMENIVLRLQLTREKQEAEKKWEPEEGEIVAVSDNGIHWSPKIFIRNTTNGCYYCATWSDSLVARSVYRMCEPLNKHFKIAFGGNYYARKKTDS